MTDDDLKAALLKHGVKAGPIVGEGALNSLKTLTFIREIKFGMSLMQFCVFDKLCMLASTRVLYEKKLRKLLQSEGCDKHLNEAEKGVLYSDSEDGEEGMTRHDVIVLFVCFLSFLTFGVINLWISVTFSGSDKAEEETVEQSDNTQQESSQVRMN